MFISKLKKICQAVVNFVDSIKEKISNFLVETATKLYCRMEIKRRGTVTKEQSRDNLINGTAEYVKTIENQKKPLTSFQVEALMKAQVALRVAKVESERQEEITNLIERIVALLPEKEKQQLKSAEIMINALDKMMNEMRQQIQAKQTAFAV